MLSCTCMHSLKLHKPPHPQGMTIRERATAGDVKAEQLQSLCRARCLRFKQAEWKDLTEHPLP